VLLLQFKTVLGAAQVGTDPPVWQEKFGAVPKIHLVVQASQEKVVIPRPCKLVGVAGAQLARGGTRSSASAGEPSARKNNTDAAIRRFLTKLLGVGMAIRFMSFYLQHANLKPESQVVA